MRIMTSTRLRAVGFLLLEAAGLALLVAKHVGKDDELRDAVGTFVKKMRAL
jgi:hypothetical protein